MALGTASGQCSQKIVMDVSSEVLNTEECFLTCKQRVSLSEINTRQELKILLKMNIIYCAQHCNELIHCMRKSDTYTPLTGGQETLVDTAEYC